MYNNIGKKISLGIISCLAIADISLAQSTIDEAHRLTEQNDFHGAFNLLKQEIDGMGDKTHDLMLGRIANLINKPDEASMACERVATLEPNNAEAKLCLARAYYDLGHYNKALSLLLTLEGKQFTIQEHNQIQELLTSTKAKIARANRNWHIYGKFDVGYDDNITAKTKTDYLDLSILTDGPDYRFGVPKNVANYIIEDYERKTCGNQDVSTLEASYDCNYNYFKEKIDDYRASMAKYNKKRSSSYLHPQIGIRGYHKLSDQGAHWYWDTNLQHRAYLEETDYDVSKVNFLVGANQLINNLYLLDGSFYYQEYLLDGKNYRRAPLLSLSVSRAINTNSVVKLYTECGSFAYHKHKDLNVYILGGGLEWRYLDYKNLLTLRSFLGRHQPRFKSDGVRYSGNDYYGARIKGRHKLTPKLSLGADFSYHNVRFDGKRFAHADRRKESFYDTSAALYYHLKPGYDWYVQCNYSNNNSNLFPYKYHRTEVFMGLSFKF